MPKLTIDQRDVEVPPGATVLDAARTLGIDIPTLCFHEGCEPSSSCLVCMVKVGHNHRMVPSCATAATEGMVVESETEDVHQIRRSALELLLSDHLGDCLAPCWFGCPAQMNIPQMLRQIAAGDLRGAIATVKADIALPAVLGRICPAPCEKVCRRSGVDGAVTICLLKRFVADVDLASGDPYLPPCQPATGKRVAIIGGGPAGLSAAYYLARRGHACTIFDENERPGGRLRREAGKVTPEGDSPIFAERKLGQSPSPQDKLPRDVLDAEIELITRLGIEVRSGTRVGRDVPLGAGMYPAHSVCRPQRHTECAGYIENTTVADSAIVGDLQGRFDAILVACGATALEQAEAWGLKATAHGIEVHRHTFETSVPGVFAAGNAVRGKGMAVRSVADGKEAAVAIGQFLAGQTVTGPLPPFNTKIGRMEPDELKLLAIGAGQTPRQEPIGGFAIGSAEECTPHAPREGTVTPSVTSTEAATEQAARCMHCDCRGLDSCRLRHYAAIYHADPRRYKAERRPFQQDQQHAEVIYEPGKCVDCGLCIQIAAEAGERLGLTFIGRGFNVRVGVPLGHSLTDALTKVAAQCIAACPTAALSSKDGGHSLSKESQP